MVTKRCFRLYVWRGHWQLRSTHDTLDQVRAEVGRVGRGVRVQVIPGTRKVAQGRNGDPPSASRAHRESASDQMVIRRQAHAYHKSGCNGTELLADPAKEKA
jgi:hypothetical protein